MLQHCVHTIEASLVFHVQPTKQKSGFDTQETIIYTDVLLPQAHTAVRSRTSARVCLALHCIGAPQEK